MKLKRCLEIKKELNSQRVVNIDLNRPNQEEQGLKILKPYQILIT